MTLFQRCKGVFPDVAKAMPISKPKPRETLFLSKRVLIECALCVRLRCVGPGLTTTPLPFFMSENFDHETTIVALTGFVEGLDY